MATIGRVVIDIVAGIGEFLPNIQRGDSALKGLGGTANNTRSPLISLGLAAQNTGRSFSEMGSHGLTDIQAVSGGLRVMEGNLNNNIRAAERFLVNILGLGPAAQAIFPVVGGIALIGIVEHLIGQFGRMYDAVQKFKEAPDRMAADFRKLNSEIDLANDELDLTNAKLEAELAKISGKPYNGIKEAIIEARVEADKLADSLNKDFGALGKDLKKHETGFFGNLFSGRAPTKDITREYGSEGESGELDRAGFPGNIKSLEEKIADDLDRVSARKYNPEVAAFTAKVNQRPAETEEEFNNETIRQKNAVRDASRAELKKAMDEAIAKAQAELDTLQPGQSSIGFLGTTQQNRIDELNEVIRTYRNKEKSVDSQYRKEDLTNAVQQKKAERVEDPLEPFARKVQELQAELAKTRGELDAVGKGSQSGKTLAKAYGEASEAAVKLNAELAKRVGLSALVQEQEGKPPLATTGAIPEAIIAAAKQQGIDPRIALAVAETESGTRQIDAKTGRIVKSPDKGALGVMQLMPGTAADLGVNPYDVTQNIQGGVKYLAQMFARYNDWSKALQAYNSGPGNVPVEGPSPAGPDVQRYAENILVRSGVTPVGVSGEQEDRRLAAIKDINDTTVKLEQAKAELAFREAFQRTNTSLAERIELQKKLTDAVGKGYVVQRSAVVEGQIMQLPGVGRENYNDPAWRAAHEPYIAQERQNLTTEYDEKKNTATAETTDKLSDQISLERSLASAQSQGADAVRLITLAYKLREIALTGSHDVLGNLTAETREHMRAVVELDQAERQNQSATNLAKIQEEIGATQRLTAAEVDGAEAVRKAHLENTYEQMRFAGAKPEEIQAQRGADEAKHQEDILASALRTGIEYQNQLGEIAQQITALEQLKAAHGDTLAIEIALHDLEVKRAQVWAQQVEVIGSAREGLRAYFQEMATSGESAAKQVHDSLKSTFDSLNDSLAKLMSGQKVNWGSFFSGISADLAKMGLKNIEANIASKFFPQGQPAQKGAEGTTPQGVFARLAGLLSPPHHQRTTAPAIASSQTTSTTGIAGLPGAKGTLGRDGQSAASAFFVTEVSQSANPSPLSGDKSAASSAFSSIPTPTPAPSRTAASLQQAFGATSNPAGALRTALSHAIGAPAISPRPTILQRQSTGSTGTTSAKTPAGSSSGEPPTVLNATDLSNLGPNPESDIQALAGLIPNFNGAYADGGPVKKGLTHLVGERGPELFVPKSDGTIVPNHKLSSLAPRPIPGEVTDSRVDTETEYREDGGPVDANRKYVVGERGKEAFTSESASGGHAPTFADQAAESLSFLGDELKGVAAAINPINIAQTMLTTGPVDMIRSLVQLPGHLAGQFQSGDMHGLAQTIGGIAGGVIGAKAMPLVAKGNASLFGEMTESAAYNEAKAGAQATKLTEKEGAPRIPDTRGLGVQYHGTSREFQELDEYRYNGRNIYGSGFYTTDALEVAHGYTKKGGGANPAVYRVRETVPVKLFDMEQPLNAEAHEAIRKTGSEYAQEILESEQPKNLRGFYDNMREFSADAQLSRDSVQEVFDGVAANLEERGYSGYTHTGGLKTKTAAHQVNIYFQPERDLSVEKVDPLSNVKGFRALGGPSSVANTSAAQPKFLLSTLADETGSAGPGSGLAAGASEPWQIPRSDLIPYKDTVPQRTASLPSGLNANDYSEEGLNARSLQLRNSEAAPPSFLQHSVGSWGLDSTGELMQLRRYRIDDPILTFPEGFKHNYTVDKYAEWTQQGSTPPPLTGLETESGNIRIQEGHHRASAIKQTGGDSANVWVSVTQNVPIGERDGQIITSPRGLTHKEAVRQAVQQGRPVPPDVLADYPDFGGFRAAGGPVDAGKTHVVGEEGPELFVPKTSGTIIPNHKLSAVADLMAISGGGTRKGLTGAIAKLPHRAEGGDVDSDQPYVTGEQGPEMYLSGDDQDDKDSLKGIDDTRSNSRWSNLSRPTPTTSFLQDLVKAVGGGASKLGGLLGRGGQQMQLGAYGDNGSEGISDQGLQDSGIQPSDVNDLAGPNPGLGSQNANALGTNAIANALDPKDLIRPTAGIPFGSLAMTGIGMGLGIISMLLNRKRDEHRKAGNPFVIPDFNSALADGGRAKRGMSHLVGERGKELFIPDAPGEIIPHHKLGTLGASHFGGYRASGGPVDPGNAYMVGELGTEAYAYTPGFSGGSSGGSAPKPISQNGGHGETYIDARNSDPAAVQQRVEQAMKASYNASVRSSFRNYIEYANRSPQTTGGG